MKVSTSWKIAALVGAVFVGLYAWAKLSPRTLDRFGQVIPGDLTP